MARDMDNTGVFGELRRMVQTTGTVGGIAARLAGNKIGLRSGGASHAEDLNHAGWAKRPAHEGSAASGHHSRRVA